jgi:hypothetical protein
LLSFTAAANTTTPYQSDGSFASDVCIEAAKSGIPSIKEVLLTNNETLASFERKFNCNGLSLRQFVRKHDENLNSVENRKKHNVQFTIDGSVDTRICADSVLIGVRAAYRVNNMHPSNNEIDCNGMTVRAFAKKFKDKNVTIVTQ